MMEMDLLTGQKIQAAKQQQTTMNQKCQKHAQKAGYVKIGSQKSALQLKFRQELAQIGMAAEQKH